MSFDPKRDCQSILSWYKNEDNNHLKFDYYKYNKENKSEKEIKALYELGRKSNPMLKKEVL